MFEVRIQAGEEYKIWKDKRSQDEWKNFNAITSKALKAPCSGACHKSILDRASFR